jgi:molecular chaperone DnaK
MSVQSKGPVIGIDLGTTNSVVAVLKDGIPVVLKVDGQKTMPSCVGISAEGDIIVGQAARNQIAIAPERTVSSIKRKMGETVEIKLGKISYRPEEISALILKKLKQAAEEALGESVDQAVITVPAYFDDRQRHATMDAGKLAGLEVLRIVNEPTAAALAYGADRSAKETLIVYDLGGGTFDVSLVQVEDRVVEVKASHGDTHLGGDDFDELLMHYMIKQSGLKINLYNNASLRRRLMLIAENTKIRLSSEASVRVLEEYIFENKHLDVKIQRPDYEALIEAHLERSMQSVSKSLSDANMLPSAIDRILLVGGSSRTPRVFEKLKGLFRKEPRFEIDPDLIVAMGAAVQGGLVTGQETQTLLVDITSQAFGIESLGTVAGQFCTDVFCPIIEKGSPIPFQKSSPFYTIRDGQKAVEVRVFQGEGEITQNCRFIGDFKIQGLDSNAPEGSMIVVHMELDSNGILAVKAVEEHTGLSKQVEMRLPKEEVALDLAASREKLGLALSDSSFTASVKTEAVPESQPQAQSLMERLRVVMETCADSDKEECREILSQLEASGGELQEELLARAEDFLYFIE